MNVQELRIGNWIDWHSTPGAYTRVNRIATFRQRPLVNNICIEDVKPIELTPEVLQGWCGFERRPYDMYSARWGIGTNPLTHDWMLLLIWIHGEPAPFYRNAGHRITYLHQLQNLYYALCGTELEVKVPG